MRRLVTWVLVIVVAVLVGQDRKKSAAIKELQAQRRWVHEAKQEHEGWQDLMEAHDGDFGVMRARMNQLAEALKIEWDLQHEQP